jgi:hypothetical protein
MRALSAFKRASIIYKEKYGKPPVIFYDNINRLAHKNPEILDIGGLNEKESTDYLVNKRKISFSEANKIYELVGDRIVELKNVADKIYDFLMQLSNKFSIHLHSYMNQ